MTTVNEAAIKDATTSTPLLGTRDIAAPAHGADHNITNRKDDFNIFFLLLTHLTDQYQQVLMFGIYRVALKG